MPEIGSLPSSLRLNDQGCIDQDLPCAACNYNLRTISVESNCPECGQAVLKTLDYGYICLVDPVWLKRLIRGLDLVVISAVVCIFNMVLVKNFFLPQWLEVVGVVELLVLSLVGHLRFVSDNPGVGADRLNGHRRQRLRLVLVMSTIVLLIAIVMKQSSIEIPMIGIPIICVSLATMALVVLGYARKIALRIPSKRLARAIRLVMWIWVVLIVGVFSVAFVQIGLQRFNWVATTSETLELFDIVIISLGFGVMVIAVVGLLLLIVFRSRLGKIMRSMGER